MRAYYSMTQREFIDQLRDSAIRTGAHHNVIAKIDDMVESPSEDDIDEMKAEANREGYAEGAESMWDDCYSALADVLSELGLDADDSEALKTAILKVKPE